MADDGWFPASNRSCSFEALCSDPSSKSSNQEKAHGITYFWEVAESNKIYHLDHRNCFLNYKWILKTII